MFNHASSWNFLESILQSNMAFKDGWKDIIAFHEEQLIDSYNDIEGFDFEKDLLSASTWFEEALATDPIPNSVKALWFGIFITADEDESNEGYCFYFTGSDNYDEHNLDNWALNPVYSPVNKYFKPERLNTLLKKIKENKPDNYSFLDWILPISYVSLMVKQLKNKLNTNFYITVGYDDGDYLSLS